MTGARLLSQRISEGDGISVIARVDDLDSARVAEAGGAEAVAATADIPGLRDATTLPVLWLGRGGAPHGADAGVLVVEDATEDLEGVHATVVGAGLECVVDVRDEEELELALERLDPEIFLLSSRDSDDDDGPLDRVLDLLADVEPGSRYEVVALERAGVDAVLVTARRVAELVGATVPDV